MLKSKEKVMQALLLNLEGLRSKELRIRTGLSSRSLYKALSELIKEGKVVKEMGGWLERPNYDGPITMWFQKTEEPKYIKSVEPKHIPIDFSVGSREPKEDVIKRLVDDPKHALKQLQWLKKNSGRWSPKVKRYLLSSYRPVSFQKS